MPADSPAVEESGQGQAQDAGSSSREFSLPIRIVEDPEEADRAKSAADDAAQRERDDLAAQQSMAESTGNIVTISWFQLGLAAFGTFAVIVGLGAAIDAARSARKQVIISDRSAHRELRAYVGAHADHIFQFDETHVIQIRYLIRNFGQTPALNMRCKGHLRVCPYPLPDTFVFPIVAADLEDVSGSRSVLFPSAPMNGTITMADTLTTAEIDAIIDGASHRVFIFIRIEYEDIFGRDHWTTYCASVAGSENIRRVKDGHKVEHGGISFSSANRYNDTDTDHGP